MKIHIFFSSQKVEVVLKNTQADVLYRYILFLITKKKGIHFNHVWCMVFHFAALGYSCSCNTIMQNASHSNILLFVVAKQVLMWANKITDYTVVLISSKQNNISSIYLYVTVQIWIHSQLYVSLSILLPTTIKR